MRELSVNADVGRGGPQWWTQARGTEQMMGTEMSSSPWPKINAQRTNNPRNISSWGVKANPVMSFPAWIGASNHQGSWWWHNLAFRSPGLPQNSPDSLIQARTIKEENRRRKKKKKLPCFCLLYHLFVLLVTQLCLQGHWIRWGAMQGHEWPGTLPFESIFLSNTCVCFE